MKKILILVLCLICFISSACVKNDEIYKTVRFSTWGSTTELSILKPIIDDYENAHPDVKIELMHIPQNYFQKIHLLFASNLAPDVVFINNLNLPVYANYLEKLDVDNSIYYPQTIEALSYNGKTLALPRDVSNLVIYFNKDIFNSENVKEDSLVSVEQLLLLAQKLTNKKHFGISYEEDLFYAMPYIYTFNQTIYDYNSPCSLIGLNFYKDLAYKYHVSPQKSEVASKTLAQLFLEQKLVMHLSGRWLYPKYKESANFNWGVCLFPGITPCDASGWAISKTSKHKKEAKDFIEYLASKENITKFANTGLIVPARKDVSIENDVFIKAIKTSKPVQIKTDYVKQLDRIKEEVFK